MMGKRLFGGGLVLLGALAIGLALQIEVLGLGQNQDPGPRAFPIVLGAILLIGGLFEIAISFTRVDSSKSDPEQEAKGDGPDGPVALNGPKNMILIFVGLCLYVGLIGVLGFALSTFLFAVSMMIRLGVRIRISLLSSLGLLLGIHLLFVRLFKVQLPTGMMGLPF
jgi:putative tricarboxylic transport membrane protein